MQAYYVYLYSCYCYALLSVFQVTVILYGECPVRSNVFTDYASYGDNICPRINYFSLLLFELRAFWVWYVFRYVLCMRQCVLLTDKLIKIDFP